METFHEHRGKVLYIPVVIPDNYLVGFAHVKGFLGAILLFIAASSSSWSTVDIYQTAVSDSAPDLKIVLTFGLRSFHVRYCEVYNETSGFASFNGCGFEDVFYSTCSRNNQYCAERGNSTQAFVILILCGLAMLGVCAAALLRLGLLPTGFTVGAWVVLLALFSYRQDAGSFVPGDVLEAWETGSTVNESMSWGYLVACVGAVFLGSAAITATMGYLRTARADQAREEDAAGEGAVAAAPPSSSGGVRRTARSEDSAVSHEF